MIQMFQMIHSYFRLLLPMKHCGQTINIISMVSCQKGPSRHACAWHIGPFWQDTLNIISLVSHLNHLPRYQFPFQSEKTHFPAHLIPSAHNSHLLLPEFGHLHVLPICGFFEEPQIDVQQKGHTTSLEWTTHSGMKVQCGAFVTWSIFSKILTIDTP